jgi:putative hydrolase of the HAD superfamily
MASMIKVILFDLGGVIVELTGVPTMLRWTNNKYDEEQLWEAWLASPAIRSYEKGYLTTEQFAIQIIDEMDLPVKKAEFIDAFRQWPKGLFPGVTRLMERLRKNYTLACLSNTNELHWPRLMNEMGLDKLFTHHFASHLMGRLKPDKEAFEYVLAQLDCSAPSVLFLDDNPINVISAEKIGMIAHRVKGPKDIEHVLGKAGIL